MEIGNLRLAERGSRSSPVIDHGRFRDRKIHRGHHLLIADHAGDSSVEEIGDLRLLNETGGSLIPERADIGTSFLYRNRGDPIGGNRLPKTALKGLSGLDTASAAVCEHKNQDN
jgi:hypothetical protein